jgi:hypothetical protein
MVEEIMGKRVSVFVDFGCYPIEKKLREAREYP